MSDLLAHHRTALETYRKVMNLVGPGDIDVHYRDCNQALDGLDPAGRWADLGSGAGFPGIVFAHRFPDVQLELVDSRRKRCVFVEQVLHHAGRSDVIVRCQRVEDLPAGVYDGLVARAFAPPDRVAVHARRLLKPGGRLLLWLNQGQQLTEADFSIEAVTPYKVDGKARKVVRARWKADG